MSKQFSEFTLNFNSGARSNDKAPTMKGKVKVIEDGGAESRSPPGDLTRHKAGDPISTI
jgi:hypothetical protein